MALLNKTAMTAIAVAWIGLAPCAVHAQTSSVEPLAGWWSAQATHGGEQTEIVIHLAEDNGKRSTLLTLPALGFWEMPFGTFEVNGNQVTMPELHADPTGRVFAFATAESGG